MTDHTSETVRIGDCGIEVLRGGSGPQLLFLHGAGGASMWAPFMDRLAERFELIVPSHPGFGRSDTPAWLDTMSDLAYFYLDAMEALNIADAHVVGNSLGGWLACEVAVRSTERMKTLTLVSPAGVAVEGVPMGDTFLWKPEERVRNTFHDQALAEARLAQNLSEEDADIALKNHFTTARLAWSPRFCNPELEKWLHRIRIPTTIIWGDDDKIFPLPHAEAFHKLIPNSTLKVIEACGHLPHQEKTDDFLECVLAITERAA